MDSESVQRLMDVLLQMRINLQQIAKTFTEQTGEIRQELETIFHAEKISLDQCIAAIDAKLIDCGRQLKDYTSIYASLRTLHEQLQRMGADVDPMPPSLNADRIEDVLRARFDALQNQGKL